MKAEQLDLFKVDGFIRQEHHDYIHPTTGLEGCKVGDPVRIRKQLGNMEYEWFDASVENVTPKFIDVEGVRFRKQDGKVIGFHRKMRVCLPGKEGIAHIFGNES